MFYTEQGKEKEREAYGDRDAGKQLRVCFALQDFTSGLVCKEGGRQCCKLCRSQIILPFLSNADILQKKKINPKCWPNFCWLRNCLYLNIRLKTFRYRCAGEADLQKVGVFYCLSPSWKRCPCLVAVLAARAACLPHWLSCPFLPLFFLLLL